ncbi:hypothetical protein T190_03085 [Sinorhizobium meliloti CCBAU 01290]|nr:hypothetical protein T190_03085 [Sinorhizobium meliloti CCBAU 01290]
MRPVERVGDAELLAGDLLRKDLLILGRSSKRACWRRGAGGNSRSERAIRLRSDD